MVILLSLITNDNFLFSFFYYILFNIKAEIKFYKKIMNKYFQGVLLVIIVALAVFLLIKAPFKQDSKQQTLTNTEILSAVNKGNLPPLGSESAPITIIEFADFLCPYCGRAVLELYPQIENLIKEGKVAVFFRDFVVHPNAVPIHNAARCANEQNKYWEFNKEIFKKFMNGENITKKDVWLSLAKDFGLNLEAFEKCVDENRYLNDIQKDSQDAYNLKVRGTPTFFINGKMIEGINIPEIMSTINQLLK